MSLKKQIILWSVFVCSGIMLVSNLFNYFNSTKFMQEQMEENILSSMKQAEYNITTLVDEVDKISKMIGTSEDLYFASKKVDKQNLEYIYDVNRALQIFENYLIHYDYLHGIFVSNQYHEWIGRDIRYTKMYDSELSDGGVDKIIKYEQIKANYPKLTLLGSCYANDFIGQGEPEKVLTFARLIPRTTDSEEYILYMNVREEALRAVYGSGAEETSESFSLLGRDKKVLSGTDDSIVGSSLPYGGEISDRQEWGKFVTGELNDKHQVFYYHLKDLDITLVREVPLSFLNSSIRVLTTNLIIMLIISVIVIILLYSLLMNKITKPLYTLVLAMKEAGAHPGENKIESKYNNEVGFLMKEFNTMNTEIGELIKEKTENESKKRDLEIELLQSQINPHFLYNTMNMIKWMAKIQKADNIAESIVALSQMLKPVFSNSNLMYTIKEELDYLNNYITIMNYRYGNHIRFQIDMEEGIQEYLMLKFSLQPIIENSFIHGFEQTGGTGEITLTIKRQEKNIRFTVRDTGKGIDKVRQQEIMDMLESGTETKGRKGHVGLANIHRRLRLTYGEGYGVQIESDGIGYTMVTVVMPQILNTGGADTPEIQK